MATKHELEITISADGEVSISVSGTKGKRCIDLTKELEETIGTVVSREAKPAFYETESTQTLIVKDGSQ